MEILNNKSLKIKSGISKPEDSNFDMCAAYFDQPCQYSNDLEFLLYKVHRVGDLSGKPWS